MQQREEADLEFRSMQKANSEKEKECKQLKNDIQAEKDRARLLQKELQTAKAVADNAAARANLDTSAVSIRRSLSSTQSQVVRNSLSRSDQMASSSFREAHVGEFDVNSAGRSSQVVASFAKRPSFDIDLTGDRVSEVVNTAVTGTLTRTENFTASVGSKIEVDIKSDSSNESEDWPK